MRDHIGGGFHRYSVDATWRVPHFEKMLYDQAQIALAYAEAAQLSGDPFYVEVAEDTLAYVRARQAFGGPLSDKQVVRHKLADLATLIEAGRALTYAALLRYQAGEEAVSEISMAKLFTAEMVQKVAYECVQLHGGYGYMREYAIERFARDARLLSIGGGTSEIMKEIIAKALLA